MTGSVFRLAKKIAEGAESAGAEVRLRKVTELIPEQVIHDNQAMHQASAEQEQVPVATLDDLTWADGIAFGSPTRYGNMTAQLKNFMDQTGSLWAEGKLVGKAAGFFTGAQTMHGGHESTILAMSTFAYHHGMVIVPASYAITQVGSTRTGGGPYGPTELGGKGVALSEEEATIAWEYGKRLADVSQLLARREATLSGAH
jgi:NAD(P)H dehydrogenase (quinone)